MIMLVYACVAYFVFGLAVFAYGLYRLLRKED